ncbi:hypothetical protein VTJ04DRAFT_3458 [Mycothermus thermophilus]|uniref:uncharacterized protein n=1 Tax=Humicola insolens TaxID=85995 RepID=UPI003743EFCC
MKTYKQITTGYNLEHRWQPRLPIAPENPEPMLEASTFSKKTTNEENNKSHHIVRDKVVECNRRLAIPR